jgi:hypothetical protein
MKNMNLNAARTMLKRNPLSSDKFSDYSFTGGKFNSFVQAKKVGKKPKIEVQDYAKYQFK